MAKELPELVKLNGRKPKDLSKTERAKYDTRVKEEARRKDPSQPGVAKEALECLRELQAANRSSSEAWTHYGYSLRGSVKPAEREETRIVRELACKPSKDIEVNQAVALVVEEVRVAKGIAEYVKPESAPAEPKDPVVKPIIEKP